MREPLIDTRNEARCRATNFVKLFEQLTCRIYNGKSLHVRLRLPGVPVFVRMHVHRE